MIFIKARDDERLTRQTVSNFASVLQLVKSVILNVFPTSVAHIRRSLDPNNCKQTVEGKIKFRLNIGLSHLRISGMIPSKTLPCTEAYRLSTSFQQT